MARKIGENSFLIEWSPRKPDDYQNVCYTNVEITEIFQSCRLTYKTDPSAKGICIFEIQFTPFLRIKGGRNYKMSKPERISVIKNGANILMKLHESKWTTRFNTASCECGQYSSGWVNLHILIELTPTSLKTENKHVMDHLSSLWETKTLADVTFKFNQENDIQAHTLIVISGSPVLAAMFQNDFKEKQERVVTIKDTKATVFEKMLQFFYTGNAVLDDVDVSDLLILANKYGVDSLKEECSLFMSWILTDDNVIQYLIISHLHQSTNLYKAALEFIAKYSETIVMKNDWIDLTKNYPELCLAAVQMIVLAKKKLESAQEMDELPFKIIGGRTYCSLY